MKKILPYLLVAMLTMGSVVYLQQNHPEVIHEALLRIDTFGITKTGADEKRRIAQIKSLKIPYEKKEVLINRTIFMGANNTMVYLALGEPKSSLTIPPGKQGNKSKIDRWVYHFANDKRPTILEFEDEVLTSAYKGSMLDLAKPAGGDAPMVAGR